MLDAGITPNQITYNTLANAYARTETWIPPKPCIYHALESGFYWDSKSIFQTKRQSCQSNRKRGPCQRTCNRRNFASSDHRTLTLKVLHISNKRKEDTDTVSFVAFQNLNCLVVYVDFILTPLFRQFRAQFRWPTDSYVQMAYRFLPIGINAQRFAREIAQQNQSKNEIAKKKTSTAGLYHSGARRPFFRKKCLN